MPCVCVHVHARVNVVTKKSVLEFRFFKVATLSLDDSFAHYWHSLNQLYEECFSNSLEGVPTYDEHLLAIFPSLCGQLIPNHLILG